MKLQQEHLPRKYYTDPAGMFAPTDQANKRCSKQIQLATAMSCPLPGIHYTTVQELYRSIFGSQAGAGRVSPRPCRPQTRPAPCAALATGRRLRAHTPEGSNTGGVSGGRGGEEQSIGQPAGRGRRRRRQQRDRGPSDGDVYTRVREGRGRRRFGWRDMMRGWHSLMLCIDGGHMYD